MRNVWSSGICLGTVGALVLAFLALPQRAFAYSDGITSNQFSSSSGCNQCHGGGSTTPTVTLSGPTTVVPGATATYTISVTGGGKQTRAGFNVNTPEGTLSGSGDSGTEEAVNSSSGRVEMTHSAPRTMTSNVATFSFQWTAPETFSSVVLTGWGNAVNGNGSTAGDKAANGTLTIAVCPDADGDGAFDEACGGTDCDDGAGAVYPGALEACNGSDDDCDSSIDEDARSTFYADTDADGYGNAAVTTSACTAPTGYVANATDCDDTRAAVHPGASESCNGIDDDCDSSIDEAVQSTFYRDADVDGYGDPSQSTTACSVTTGYVVNALDCDDTQAGVNPAATETCNEIDDDCDTGIDEGVMTTWYLDADGDGYGASSTLEACTKPSGYSAVGTDCDDGASGINPGTSETTDECGDGIDQNCNGQDLSCDDFDQDGDGQSPVEGDCDDTNGAIYLGASELCGDGIDQDCSGTDLSCDLVDGDGDGYTPAGGDCDDTNGDIHPGTDEMASQCDDGIDQDCNGQDLSCSTVDQDGDGQTPVGGDCDDADGSVYSGATEVPYDGLDQDCTFEDLTDVDGDGFTAEAAGGDDCDDGAADIYLGASEVCGDGVDNDCDGTADNRDQDGDGVVAADCAGDDCDDSDFAVSPDAGEVANGVDDNCSGEADEGTALYDDDGDGYSEEEGDCTDADASVHPGAEEVCWDGIDQNCISDDDPCADDATPPDDSTPTDDPTPDGSDEGGGCGCDHGARPAGPAAGGLALWAGAAALFLYRRRASGRRSGVRA